MEKIFQIVDEWPPEAGGIGVYAKNLAAASNGHVKSLIVKPLPTRLKLFSVIMSWIKEGKKHFITHHVYPVGAALYLLSYIKPINYDVVLHGLDFDIGRRNFLRRSLLRSIIRRAQILFTNSHVLKLEVQEFSKRPVHALHPVVETVGMNQVKDKWGSPLRLLTVGRLVERKGHIAMLEALSASDIPFIWNIVGDGPMRTKIQNRIEDLNMQDRCIVHGFVSQSKRDALYKDADIFLMATHKTKQDREGFGIVYVEAQLAGLPVIASDFPEMHESVGPDNVLVASPSKIPSAINQLISKDRIAIGKANQRFASQFSIERMAEILSDTYGWN
jgi:glycosyltransferase involved in cell wall biosynthesis